MKISYSLTINAPIETVFTFVEEEDDTKEWNPLLESVTNPVGFDPQHLVGTKFVQGIRQPKSIQHVIGRVTAYDKPNLLSLRLTHYDYTAHITYRLTHQGQKTRVDFESDLTSTNWLHTLFIPVMRPFNRHSIIQQLYQLRVAVEKSLKKS